MGWSLKIPRFYHIPEHLPRPNGAEIPRKKPNSLPKPTSPKLQTPSPVSPKP